MIKTIVCCDRCNPDGDRKDGGGYIEFCDEKTAIKRFGWNRFEDILYCDDCWWSYGYPTLCEKQTKTSL